MSRSKEQLLEACARMCKHTLMETLEITYCDVGKDYLVAKMPVTPRVHQPDGVLHGGAMVALAESVGSAAAYVFLDTQNCYVRGIEIAANHVKSVREGEVFARAILVHKGRTTQLWDIKIRDAADQLISVVKLTTMTLPKKVVE